jgi:hypothetical protein
MPNPIFAQRALKAQLAAEAAAKPPAPPAPPVTDDAPTTAPAAVRPADPRLVLETFPDDDLHDKASVLDDYDPDWDRETVITRLLEAGVE